MAKPGTSAFQRWKKAEALIDHEQPLLLIGSPMCSALSHFQSLNKNRRGPDVIEKELAEARIHWSWCCRLCRKQLDRGADLLHDHPALAKSLQ